MTSFYFNTGGNADQEDDVELAFDQLWVALAPSYPTFLTLDEYRWYFSASLVPRGSPWGDAARVIDRNLPGLNGNSMLPPQVSPVVSYLRPSPNKRHPGRNYFPAPCTPALSAGGYIAPAFLDTLADAVTAFLNACVAVGYQPVTIARIQGVDTALIIPELSVDDVWDTQRRRKWEAFTTRETRTVNTIP